MHWINKAWSRAWDSFGSTAVCAASKLETKTERFYPSRQPVKIIDSSKWWHTRCPRWTCASTKSDSKFSAAFAMRSPFTTAPNKSEQRNRESKTNFRYVFVCQKSLPLQSYWIEHHACLELSLLAYWIKKLTFLNLVCNPHKYKGAKAGVSRYKNNYNADINMAFSIESGSDSELHPGMYSSFDSYPNWACLSDHAFRFCTFWKVYRADHVFREPQQSPKLYFDSKHAVKFVSINSSDSHRCVPTQHCIHGIIFELTTKFSSIVDAKRCFYLRLNYPEGIGLELVGRSAIGFSSWSV